MDTCVKVTTSYSTRGSEKKVLDDAIKASNSSTTKRTRLKKVVMVEKEKNIKAVEICECEEIDSDVTAAIKKRGHEIHIVRRTRSSSLKSGRPFVSKKTYCCQNKESL